MDPTPPPGQPPGQPRPAAQPLPPGRPPFPPPPGTPYGGPPHGATWEPPPGSVFGADPDVVTGKRPRGRRGRCHAWPRSAPPVPGNGNGTGNGHASPDKGSRAVAILLAVAAIVAALITARATLLGSDATSAWQASVQQEQKRGALALESARYTYTTEGAMAFAITTALVRAQEQRAAAASQPPDVAPRLLAEADIQQQVADLTTDASEIASDPKYALPGGGYDLQQRLADRRAEDLGDPPLDPDARIVEGDVASDLSIRMMSTTIPVGLAFLLGAMAQATRRPRRLLLALGWASLLVAAILALAVQLTT